MNRKNMEKLFAAHAESTAPDMEKLWERIEDGLADKASPWVTSAPARKKFPVSRAAVWGTVCAAVLIILPIAARNIGKDEMSADSAAPETAAAEFTEEYSNDAETEYANGGTVYYEDLDLAPAVTADVAPSGETSGDDFFVEKNVLIETDVIVNAYIDKVYSRGGTVCYELTAENAETHETSAMTIESASPYVMLENRSYLLPLKESAEGYSLAFENGPQIEETQDGGLIFHNGWQCLDDGSAQDVVYPKRGENGVEAVDDFFYDRMKFSYSADSDSLVKKWRAVKKEELP